ncbi:pancreatic triacylglycerol lipase-like [Dreissena polymorpha]|uniref:PLAT domain-containing protein n=1 Tax=Dreissena polymorpha TaxID=45954 RepID=A0A9D4EP17_DREPO|nr:pancreatic triacylglycerol lipase-like [Dreissena polymorpha]KAH3782803.1 hypothetical protein DPMN_160723 [Dreissena polymorpha]
MRTSGVFLAFLALCGSARARSVAQDKRSTVCYDDLGCFSTGGAFTSLFRPLNLNPQSPNSINPRFLLFTRENPATGSQQFLRYNDYNGLEMSHFKGSRPTKVICHGFLENGFVDWMNEMKDELLKNGDYNVVLVDWGGGSGIPYTQATANTRVVGAVLAKLLNTMQTHADARPEDMHLIGHSLGAHICGYAGERTPNLGRISGMDPADPYFQNTDVSVRLDPSDAKFVDVMHTNGDSILALGYGMKQSCGHVDYFPNEGLNQPGCDANPVTTMLTEGDIYEGAKQIVACSHLRAYQYYTESINSRCPFQGYSCKSYADYQRGLCMPCTSTNCGYMGFHADRAKPPAGQTLKAYYLQTGKTAPFCRYHYQVDIQFGTLPSGKTEKGTLSINVIGSKGETGQQLLTEDPMDIQQGHTYGFVLTSTHDIGDVTQLRFSWTVDSHWYNPLTWSLIFHHAIHVSYIDVINGETSARKHFCGFTEEIGSEISKLLSKTC